MSSPDVRRAARGVCALMVACWLSFSAASLVAQEGPAVETVEVTEAQAELNEQGVAAVNSGNFQVAINLFKASSNLYSFAGINPSSSWLLICCQIH